MSGLSFLTVAPLTPGAAQALDMDAFMNSELASDKAACNEKTDSKCVPKLSQDEGTRVENAGGGDRRVEFPCIRFPLTLFTTHLVRLAFL